MNFTEQYFPVVLFIMLCKVVLILSLWMKSLSVTIQMKATEQYFLFVLIVSRFCTIQLSVACNDKSYSPES